MRPGGDRRGEIADAWLRGTGFSLVVALGLTRDLPPVLPFFGENGGVAKIVAARSESQGLKVVVEAWFLNARMAQLVFERSLGQLEMFAMGELGAGWAEVDPAAAARLVKEAADELEFQVRGGNEIADMALAAADKVIEISEQQRKSGELKALNAAYKAYRKRSANRVKLGGEPTLRPERIKPLDYQDWLHRYRVSSAVSAGNKIRQRLRFST